MKPSTLFAQALITLGCCGTLPAQHPTTNTPTPIVKPLAAAATTQTLISTSASDRSVGVPTSDSTITGTDTIIRNRSLVLKDKVDGQMNRYFSVEAQDIVHKSQSDLQKLLTPTPITAGQKVKQVQIVINDPHPIFLDSDKPIFTIGTQLIDGNVKNIRVVTDINLAEVKITRKK